MAKKPTKKATTKKVEKSKNNDILILDATNQNWINFLKEKSLKNEEILKGDQ